MKKMADEPKAIDKAINEKVERGKQIVRELTGILQDLPDLDVGKLLGTEAMDDLLSAILDPSTVKNYPTIGEFFLQNKMRAITLARIRHAITINYSIKATKGGQERYISPDTHQWVEDGIILLEGKVPFTGFITLYLNKELKIAIAGRDIEKGDDIVPDDLKLINIDEYKEYTKTIPPNQVNDLERPIREIMYLINRNESDESKYQELLEKYPWVFGAEYSVIQRHEFLDDENIPDFTGVKVSGGYRDIFELKPPTMKVFAKSGDFTSDFNRAWNQAERYLDFVHRNEDYLRKKGRIFDNPKCHLILGWNLSNTERQKIRIKERGNPSIHLRTYNDLISFMESTVSLLKVIVSNSQSPSEPKISP
jgi:hypothetical protein